MQLGILKEKTGDYAAAINAFRHLDSLKPDDAEAHFNLGVALGKNGQIGEAIRELSKSLELNPKNREALLHRAVAFEFLGDRARASGDFAAAMALPEEKQSDKMLREPILTSRLKDMLTVR